jgi:hypothetical protein
VFVVLPGSAPGGGSRDGPGHLGPMGPDAVPVPDPSPAAVPAAHERPGGQGGVRCVDHAGWGLWVGH